MGARPTYEANQAVTIYFTVKSAGVRQTGLTGTISIEVFDEAEVSFATPAETELGATGIYKFSFTPDAAGFWPFTIDESSLPWEGGGVIEVVAENNATKLDNIEAKVDDLQGAGFVTADDSNEAIRNRIDNRLPDILSLVAIEQACDDAMDALRLDELVLNNLAPNPNNNSLFGILMFSDGGSSSDRSFASFQAQAAATILLPNQVDSVQLLVTGGTASAVQTDADEADGFWDNTVLTVVRQGAGGAGARPCTAYLNANGEFALETALPFTPAVGDVCYVTSRRALAPPAAAANASAVWNALTASHVAAGSLGLALGTTAPTERAAILAAIALLNNPTAAAIADAVWDELTAAHVGAGSFGLNLQTILTTGGSGPWTTGTAPSAVTVAAAVWNALTAAHIGVGSFGLNLQTILTTGGGGPWTTGAVPPTVAAIADAVWDELLAGHVIAGSAGATLAAAGGGATPATIAAAVWNALIASHVAAGSFGLDLQTIRSQGGPGPWTTGDSGSNFLEGV